MLKPYSGRVNNRDEKHHHQQRLRDYRSREDSSTSQECGTTSCVTKRMILRVMMVILVATIFLLIEEDSMMNVFSSSSSSLTTDISGGINGFLNHRKLPCVSGGIKARLGKRILCDVETSLPDAEDVVDENTDEDIINTNHNVEPEDNFVPENIDVIDNVMTPQPPVPAPKSTPLFDSVDNSNLTEEEQKLKDEEPPPPPPPEEESEEEESPLTETEERLKDAIVQNENINGENDPINSFTTNSNINSIPESNIENEPVPDTDYLHATDPPKSLADTFATDPMTKYNSDEITEKPSGTDHVAFVVTIPSCPEDVANPTADDDAGFSFYDAAAILHESVCGATIQNPESGSKYNGTLYGIIHPDAQVCKDANGNDYDRVALLEELGYWVLTWREPIQFAELEESKSSVQTTVGIRDTLKFYAYNLTQVPIAVMVKFDTIFEGSVDSIIDELRDSSTQRVLYTTRSDGVTMNDGMVFVKTSTMDFNLLVDQYKSTSFDLEMGWGDHSGIVDLGVEGFLSHFYQMQRNLAILKDTIPGVISFASVDECGKPWQCYYDDNWDDATKETCKALHHAWFSYRKQFEAHWSKTDVVNTDTNSDFHTDFFLGYCTNSTEQGYPRASDFQSYVTTSAPIYTHPPVVSSPTPQPTPWVAPDFTQFIPQLTQAPVTPDPTPVPTMAPTPVPTMAPTPFPTAAPSDIDLTNDWLEAHNTRRMALYDRFPEYVPPGSNTALKWSESVAASAQGYAEKLISQNGCQISHKYMGDSYGNENMAFIAGVQRVGHRSPEQLLEAWYDEEIDLQSLTLVGAKKHAWQVAFRSTQYLGCGRTEKFENGEYCYIEVCRYIAAGNCPIEQSLKEMPFLEAYMPDGCMEQFPDTDWLCSALSENGNAPCQPNPTCPAEGCF